MSSRIIGKNLIRQNLVSSVGVRRKMQSAYSFVGGYIMTFPSLSFTALIFSFRGGFSMLRDQTCSFISLLMITLSTFMFRLTKFLNSVIALGVLCFRGAFQASLRFTI